LLVRLGAAIVDSDEVVYARAMGNDMEIEVLFKSHSKVFSRGERVRIDSDNPKADLDAYIKCLAS
jgi:hypothetical protein